MASAVIVIGIALMKRKKPRGKSISFGGAARRKKPKGKPPEGDERQRMIDEFIKTRGITKVEPRYV